MTGKNHDRTSATLTPAFALALALLTPTVSLPLALVGYTIGWVSLSPDLDLPRSNPKRRWGPFGFIWIPYAATHKHRGRSHWPVFGSLERFAYLLVPVAAIVWAVQPATVRDVEWATALNLWPLWLGVEVACLWHLCCDYLPGLRKL